MYGKRQKLPANKVVVSRSQQRRQQARARGIAKSMAAEQSERELWQQKMDLE